MTSRWFISRNKEKVGPFSAQDLSQLARHGLLRPEEHVWLEGASKWAPAGTVPGLFPPKEKKYWIAVGGKSRGPFVAEQIRAGLNAHQFSLESQACAVGEERWTPLRELLELKDFRLDTVPLTVSRALLLVGSLEFEEATLHLAGKEGDQLAKLISKLMDLKRSYAANPALAQSLALSIDALRAKREGGQPKE